MAERTNKTGNQKSGQKRSHDATLDQIEQRAIQLAAEQEAEELKRRIKKRKQAEQASITKQGHEQLETCILCTETGHPAWKCPLTFPIEYVTEKVRASRACPICLRKIMGPPENHTPTSCHFYRKSMIYKKGFSFEPLLRTCRNFQCQYDRAPHSPWLCERLTSDQRAERLTWLRLYGDDKESWPNERLNAGAMYNIEIQSQKAKTQPMMKEKEKAASQSNHAF